MVRHSKPFVPLAILLVTSACHEEPARVCERVRFGWPHFEISPESDTNSAEDGIQIDFVLRSDLLAGATVNLFITAEDEEPVLVAEALATESGEVPFSNVSVPIGDIVIHADAKDSCGFRRSGLQTFVWDGLGVPECSLTIPNGPAIVLGEIPTLTSEHDVDLDLPGLQVQVQVETGRPDIQVALFALDRTLLSEQEFSLDSDSTNLVSQMVTLEPGEHAFRGVCFWEPEALYLNSPTWSYQVQ